MDMDLLLTGIVTPASGIPLTPLLAGASLALGFTLAVPLGFMRASGKKWLSLPILVYTYVFRGTPLLVQLFIIYYGLRPDRRHPVERALGPASRSLLVLPDCLFAERCGLCDGDLPWQNPGYASGMVETADAIGMSPLQVKRDIIFPIAFKSVLPSCANEVISPGYPYPHR